MCLLVRQSHISRPSTRTGSPSSLITLVSLSLSPMPPLLLRLALVLSLHVSATTTAFRLNGLFLTPAVSSRSLLSPPSSSALGGAADDLGAAERTVLDCLGNDRAGGSQQQLEQALRVLQSSGQAVEATVLEDNWKLLYTSSSSFDFRNPLGKRADGSAPGLERIFRTIFGDGDDTGGGFVAASSSPIQRSVLSAPGVKATQQIVLSGADPRVDQCVRVGPAFLKLSASATFDEASGRIDFLFDEAFVNAAGIRIPYPVPFRLLGDEARGYLDTSYVSEKLRISTGNKGTTFVLVRDSGGGE